jgi:hypothetical protein
VTIDEVWIGKWIYWALTLVTTTNYESHWVTHSKPKCNYSTHKGFITRYLVPAFTGELPPGLSYQLLTSHKSNSQPTQYEVKFKAKVTLRLAVYRHSLRLGIKPLETHDQRLFFQLNFCCNGLYVTSSMTKRWAYLLWICFTFRQVYISSYSMLFKIIPFALYKSLISLQALQRRSSYLTF